MTASSSKDRSNSANSASSQQPPPITATQSVGGATASLPYGAATPAVSGGGGVVPSNSEIVGRIYLAQLSTAPFEMDVKDNSARRNKELSIRRRGRASENSPRARASTIPAHLSDEFDSDMDSLTDGDEDFPAPVCINKDYN